MIKLCVFDLDGTVLDTVHTIAHYGNLALEENGIEAIPTDEYKYLAGTGIKNLVKNMLNFRNCYSEETYEKVFKVYDDAYNKDVAYKTIIFDGLKDVLDELKANGIKLSIVSNKPDFATKEVVKSLYGEGYFDFVIGQRDGIPLKPDPVSVFEVIKASDVNLNECLYIGDTSVDMQTGKNSGLTTIGVLWGFRDEKELRENGADFIISNPSELLEIAKK